MKKLVFLILLLSATCFSQEEAKVNETLTTIESLIENNQKKEAKKLLKTLPKSSFTDGQNYRYQQILKRVHTNQVGVAYEVISFSEEYRNQNTWNTFSVDYQHLIGATTLIGRVTHSNRTQLYGTLYEIESYPVFSKKSYAFISTSFSDGGFFQKFGVSGSYYQSIGKGYEIEGGFRYLDFEQDSFLAGIIGLTKYLGRFYLNLRASIGPEKQNTFIQNYIFSGRYYLKNDIDFISARIGTGISPDDATRFSQVVNNPSLNAYFLSFGFQKWFGNFNLGTGLGYLIEDIASTTNGNQFSFTIGLRRRL